MARSGGTDVVIMAPLSQDFLCEPGAGPRPGEFQVLRLTDRIARRHAGQRPRARIPPKNNFLDMQVHGASPVPVMFWDSPGIKDKGSAAGANPHVGGAGNAFRKQHLPGRHALTGR